MIVATETTKLTKGSNLLRCLSTNHAVFNTETDLEVVISHHLAYEDEANSEDIFKVYFRYQKDLHDGSDSDDKKCAVTISPSKKDGELGLVFTFPGCHYLNMNPIIADKIHALDLPNGDSIWLDVAYSFFQMTIQIFTSIWISSHNDQATATGAKLRLDTIRERRF